MFVTADTALTVQADPNDLWEYVADPANWTASNPNEHYGLTYFSPENRPAQGVEFHQRERVAGVYAELRGRIVYMEKPNFNNRGQTTVLVLKRLERVSMMTE